MNENKEATFPEMLAEELKKLPTEKRELIAALLLGTCEGLKLAESNKDLTTA